jgi:hypothetical protein
LYLLFNHYNYSTIPTLQLEARRSAAAGAAARKATMIHSKKGNVGASGGQDGGSARKQKQTTIVDYNGGISGNNHGKRTRSERRASIKTYTKVEDLTYQRRKPRREPTTYGKATINIWEFFSKHIEPPVCGIMHYLPSVIRDENALPIFCNYSD